MPKTGRRKEASGLRSELSQEEEERNAGWEGGTSKNLLRRRGVVGGSD